MSIFRFGLFIFFMFFVFIMTVFINWFLPETKGIPIEDMAGIWEKHWFWKRFVTGPGDDGEKNVMNKEAIV